MNVIVRAVAHRAAHHAQARGWFDIRYGFERLRSPDVRLTKKLLALGIGLAITALLAAFEFPLEALLSVLLPFFGLGLDLAIDGVEFVALPIVFASMILSKTA